MRAFSRLAELYPSETFFVNVTSNVILKEIGRESYSVFYGQGFGKFARELFFGKGGEEKLAVESLYQEHRVTDISDAANLPITFSVEDFATVYKRTFSSSSVNVLSLINLIYIFSLGLENYERDKRTQGQKWIKLF